MCVTNCWVPAECLCCHRSKIWQYLCTDVHVCQTVLYLLHMQHHPEVHDNMDFYVCKTCQHRLDSETEQQYCTLLNKSVKPFASYSSRLLWT